MSIHKALFPHGTNAVTSEPAPDAASVWTIAGVVFGGLVAMVLFNRILGEAEAEQQFRQKLERGATGSTYTSARSHAAAALGDWGTVAHGSPQQTSTLTRLQLQPVSSLPTGRVSSHAPANKPPVGASRSVFCTSYSSKYEGRRMRGGPRYYHSLMICAVPRSEYKRLANHWLRFTRGNRSITVIVKDSCGWRHGREVRAFDLSLAAWKTLYPGLKAGRERARMEVVR